MAVGHGTIAIHSTGVESGQSFWYLRHQHAGGFIDGGGSDSSGRRAVLSRRRHADDASSFASRRRVGVTCVLAIERRIDATLASSVQPDPTQLSSHRSRNAAAADRLESFDAGRRLGSQLDSFRRLDSPDVLQSGQWIFGKREVPRAECSATWISREFFGGAGAVRLVSESTSNEPLGGGYEGTVAMLSSPRTAVAADQAVRIDAMVRTIGFGHPHQGVLVYDSIGGQEAGVLVRGATEWTPVRLYRQNDSHKDVQVMFELIGDGEAIVDEVSLQVWDPAPLRPLPFRPLNE